MSVSDPENRAAPFAHLLREAATLAGGAAAPDAALFEQAIELCSEGIAILDARTTDFPLVYVNAGFELQTGYARDEVLGKSARLIHGPDTDLDAVNRVRQALRAREGLTEELLSYRKDGTPYWNRIALTPLRDAAGDVTHFVSIQSDVSGYLHSQVEVQGALELLEKMNAQLTRSNRRMQKNLQAAARVQQALLPDASPSVPGVRFAWLFQPCEALAGDILNLFKLDKKNVGMYLLDVTGHGTAAALLAVSVSRVLEPARHASSLVRDHDHGEDACHDRIVPPDEVANRLNRQFPWDPEIGQFFTLVYGVLNAETRVFRYAAAGHPDPLVLHADGQLSTQKSDGVPIGVASSRYDAQHITLAPGDRVYVYSDGVIETRNRAGCLFGRDRLAAQLRETRDGTLEESLQTLKAALVAWQESQRFDDDVTLLAFEIAAEE